MRLRLQLDDSLEQHFPKVWLFVPESSRLISDVTFQIIEDFSLQAICPQGIVLTMDDFVLHPTQPLTLIPETAVVKVSKFSAKRKREDDSEKEPKKKKLKSKREDDSEQEPKKKSKPKKDENQKGQQLKTAKEHKKAEEKEKDIKKTEKSEEKKKDKNSEKLKEKRKQKEIQKEKKNKIKKQDKTQQDNQSQKETTQIQKEKNKSQKETNQMPQQEKNQTQKENNQTKQTVHPLLQYINTLPAITQQEKEIEKEEVSDDSEIEIIHTQAHLRTAPRPTVESWQNSGWRVGRPEYQPKRKKRARRKSKQATEEQNVSTEKSIEEQRDYLILEAPNKALQVGDVIAFKMLEVISWAPAVSDWKEGKILSIDGLEKKFTISLLKEIKQNIMETEFDEEEMGNDENEKIIEEKEEDLIDIRMIQESA